MKLSTGILYHTMSARTSRLAAEIRPPDAVRLLLCWAILGVGTGALLYSADPALADSPFFSQGLAVSTEVRSLWQVCRTALCPMLLLLAGVMVSGCAAFGQIPALLLLFSRGVAFGLSSAACMENRSLRDALCITAVLILPYGFCSILLLCCAVRDALRRAGRMTKFLLHGTAEAESAENDVLSAMLGQLLLTLLAAGMHTLLIWQLNDRLLIM
ncbi:MAG: hypothetical protein IKQ91_01445 [Oscillospiraceae bacterium]|nr:hypothetical protein [Oscillospiraceae bacterium]